MPDPENRPKTIPRIWLVAGVTYGLVIATTILAVVAYRYLLPPPSSEQEAREKANNNVLVGGAWVPAYPGALTEDANYSTHGDVTEGILRFKSADPPGQVLAFYRKRRVGGLQFKTLTESPGGGSIEARARTGHATIRITVNSSTEGSEAVITTVAKEDKK